MKEEQLYIPYGLSNRREYFPGFGRPEAIKTAILFLFGLGVGFLVNISLDNAAVIVILAVAGGGLGIMIFTQDANKNSSVVDQAKQMITYLQSQKEYNYERSEEIDCEIKAATDNCIDAPERLSIEVENGEGKSIFLPLPVRRDLWEDKLRQINACRHWNILGVASTILGVEEAIKITGKEDINKLNYLAALYEQVNQNHVQDIEKNISELEIKDDPLKQIINVFLLTLHPQKKSKKNRKGKNMLLPFQSEADIPAEYKLDHSCLEVMPDGKESKG